MEVWCTELEDERELLKAYPVEKLYAAPAQRISDNGVLVTVADEQGGRLPTRGSPQSINTTETYHFPLCSTGDDDSYGLDSDKHGQYVELCFTAEMLKVVFSERQHMILDVDSFTAMPVYETAAAKRAVVVKEDDLLTDADIQANPVMVSKALYTERKIWFGSKRFKMRDISGA
eukprot:5654599-Pyramimonas_sp.AAC.1